MNQFSLRQAFFRLAYSRQFFHIALLLLSLGYVFAGRAGAWQPSPPGGLLITEFYYNPPGLDEEREWVEIANLSDQPYQLSGYGLGDEEKIGGGEGMLRFPEASEIGPGEVIVVARTAVGFRALFGASPDYEIQDADTAVPDMIADFQWASGQFGAANDGDEIILVDDQNNILDSLNYGDQVTFFNPSIPLVVSGLSIERIPAMCDTDSAVDWRPQPIPTPGELITDGQCLRAPEPDPESGPHLKVIGEIQGSGEVSPSLNQVVSFRGLVTGLQEDQNASGVIYYTMFVQDVPGFEDGDPATSDAVAVFLGRQKPHYQIGDQVLVTGQVTEYFGLTEIDDSGLYIELVSQTYALPDAAIVEMPQDAGMALDYLEAHEGMLVSTEGLLPVFGPTHSGCGFSVGSSSDSIRPISHSGLEPYPPPILVLNQSDVDCSTLPPLKSGDLVAGIEGPLTYHFEQYKVVQQDMESLQVEHTGPVQLTEPPQASENWIRVATLNLDNYLTPSPDQEENRLSGQLSLEETKIKQRKLAYTIGHTLGCPELLGVQEVESESLLLELAHITADTCGFLYQVTHRESADGRGIDVALFSDPRRVTVDEVKLRQVCWPLATGVHDSRVSCSTGEEPLFSRPPLEVGLRADGEPMTIFVNHFKSKRGGESQTAPRRLAQARHVHDLVRNHLANDPQAGIIVLGDFNDFNLSAVWQQLQEGGVLYDTTQMVSPQERYSYIFNGASQLMDGILLSPALVHRAVNAAISHINADYPITFALDDSPSGLPFYTSDHDPVFVIINSISHSTISEAAAVTATRPGVTPTIPVRPTAPSPTAKQPLPTITIQPTAHTPMTKEPSPTAQPVEPRQMENENGSRQYLFFAVPVMLLLVTAVGWLARRKFK